MHHHAAVMGLAHAVNYVCTKHSSTDTFIAGLLRTKDYNIEVAQVPFGWSSTDSRNCRYVNCSELLYKS